MTEDRAPKQAVDEPEVLEVDEFDRFKELTRRLVAVPKSEVDAARAADRAARR